MTKLQTKQENSTQYYTPVVVVVMKEEGGAICHKYMTNKIIMI